MSTIQKYDDVIKTVTPLIFPAVKKIFKVDYKSVKVLKNFIENQLQDFTYHVITWILVNDHGDRIEPDNNRVKIFRNEVLKNQKFYVNYDGENRFKNHDLCLFDAVIEYLKEMK